MPGDGYDRDRDDFKNNDRGRIFEDGTERYFRENERNGYTRGLEVPTDQGPRRYDKGKILPDGRILAVEDKSGRVISENDFKELGKDRELLEKGKVDQLLIRTVEGEKISDKAKQLIKEMQKKFGHRVVHQVIPRWQAREIWARGLEVWKEKQRQKEKQPRQLELIRTYELTRADRARKRLTKIREIVRQREAQAKEGRAHEKVPQQREIAKEREREPAEQARTREDHRDKAKPPAITREHTDPTLNTKDAREREEAQARKMVDSLGLNLSNEQKEQVQAILREGRENQRKDLAREIEPPRGQQPPAPPPVPQRTPAQERENARAIAKEAGLSPEIIGILGLNSSAPPPMIDLDQGRTHAESEAERSKRQQRERERTAREREGRYRGE